MNKAGKVTLKDKVVGDIWQDEDGYWFKYLPEYVINPEFGPVSLTLPVRDDAYHSEENLIPFFDGLIPEGWLLDLTIKNWKLDGKDRMQLLLTVCMDCIGAVGIIRNNENEDRNDEEEKVEKKNA